MENVQIEKIQRNGEALLKKENIFLLANSFVLGSIFDILFYGKALGISYPLFVIAFYGSLFYHLKSDIGFKMDFKSLLCIPIIALSFTYFIFSNMLFKVLNFMAIPVLIVVHTLLLTSNNRYKWFETGFIKDFLYGILARPLANVSKPFRMIGQVFKSKSKPERFASMSKVLVGLAISIPLLIVIIRLLASADEVFNHFIGQIPNVFNSMNMDEFLSRTSIIIVVTCILFSYLWSLLNQKLKMPAEPAKEFRFIDPVTALTVLIMVDIIYIAFIAIQFSYLFGSLVIGLPESFTYAEYARRGFFELVAVTLINLAILLGNLNFIKTVQSGANKLVKLLSSVLVACTMVILVSAHFRMSLYEEAYGYTYLRVLTHAFMLYLFVIMAATLYKIWRNKSSLIRLYAVISIIAYVGINYANIDVIIAKNNVVRYNRENRIDVSYLTSLSNDALPYLVDFADSGVDKETELKLRDSFEKRKLRLQSKNSWQSFNIAELKAKKLLSR